MSVDKLLTFEDIQNKKVRTWNRCAMWFRAGAQGGLAAAGLYLKGLDEAGAAETVAMLKDIQQRGYTTVRREVVGSV